MSSIKYSFFILFYSTLDLGEIERRARHVLSLHHLKGGNRVERSRDSGKWSNFPPLVVVRENVDHGVPVNYHTRGTFGLSPEMHLPFLNQIHHLIFPRTQWIIPVDLSHRCKAVDFCHTATNLNEGRCPPFFLAYLEFWISATEACWRLTSQWQGHRRLNGNQMVGYHSWRRLIRKDFGHFSGWVTGCLG